MLIGEGIKKTFAGEEVLHGVNLAVEPGNITVLIGPNGGGKSTLLKALSLLEPPDEGTIRIDEEHEYRFPLGPDRKILPPWPRVTAVFQQLFLWPHLTLRQNITLPARKRRKLDRGEALAKLIKLFDMSHFIDRYPNQTSLGQRQRAALARALILNPSYLILDEITSALDVEQIRTILTHLRALRDEGVGILVVTHLPGFARRVADRVVFLDEGRVIEEGGPELIDAPRNERVRRFLSMYKSDADKSSELQYIADIVLAQIRDGHFPEDANAEFLNRFQLIDILRDRVEEKDVSLLLNVVESDSGPSAAFAASLLRSFCRREDVQARLRTRWESASDFLRCYLLWRILDDPDLPLEWHVKLFDFIFDKWDTFKNEQMMFWGTRQNVLAGIRRRMSDPTFPKTKTWAYLCCLPELAEDRGAAEAAVRNGLDSSDPFTRKVAGKLLARFFVKEAV